MSNKSIKSNLKRLDAMSDKDIDYSEIAEFDEEFLRTVEMKITPEKRTFKIQNILEAEINKAERA